MDVIQEQKRGLMSVPRIVLAENSPPSCAKILETFAVSGPPWECFGAFIPYWILQIRH